MYLSDPHILEDWRLLWKANWTDHASRVLKKFETDVIFKVGGEWVVSIVCLLSASSSHQVKSDNYDGSVHKEDEPTQWSLSGSLLYCVTIISTIGRCHS